jgi:4-hydroxybenzoate polyprenyltransferase
MGPFASLRTVLEMIKFEHTLFALPFALVGMLLAAQGLPDWRTLFWIVAAMVGARSAAMSFNRLADRSIDAANPRTADRALPTGAVTPVFVAGFVVVSSSLLVLAAWKLNPLALKLSPLALLIILGYSFSKRFTPWSHLLLGLALAGAPLGAWIAVRGDVTATPLILGLAVLCWVAGFDILYALQDLEFDRQTGLHSIPARYGEVASLWLSAILHLVTLLLLATIPWVYPPGLGTPYWIGLFGCSALLAYQHWIVRPGDLSRLDAAFFQANGLLALWFLAAVALDFWL